MIQNAIVALIPILQTAHDIIFGCARLEPKERVREIVLNDVVLRREVIRFGFASLADSFGKLVALMHVMGDWAEVIEKFAEDIPSALTRHHIGADQGIARNFHGVL
jgi:hypothetical protein